MYYVYLIQNRINQKIYIGKRKSNNPEKDSYMGSGKLIKSAIQKYGKENFQKVILGVFDSHEEAANLESLLVTQEFISSGYSYNLHEGGYGGFLHINNLPIDERPNVVSIREKCKSGVLRIGGSDKWTAESRDKVVNRGKLNNELGLTSGWQHTSNTKRRLSETSSGTRNSQYGKKSYTNVETNEKKRFLVGKQPDGWELTTLLNENRMVNSKRWYNDGNKNYYLVLPNPLIEELKLQKGRLKIR